jgi:hypothetical protein
MQLDDKEKLKKLSVLRLRNAIPQTHANAAIRLAVEFRLNETLFSDGRQWDAAREDEGMKQ